METTKMTQKECVYQVVVKYAHPELKIYRREDVINDVELAFIAGVCEFKDKDSNLKKLDDAVELRRYVSGMITNWQKRDKRLQEYKSDAPATVPKEPKVKQKEPRPIKTKALKFKVVKEKKSSKVFKRDVAVVQDDIPF